MSIKNLLLEDCSSLIEVLEYAQQEASYQYVWGLQVDKVVLGYKDDLIEQLDLMKLVEARIFGEGCEIHIFQQGKRFAVETKDWKNEYIQETQKLKKSGSFRKFSSIQLRHYIDYDAETGQAYICGTCLNGWEAF